MEPRLKSSKKWTAFPKDFLEQMQAVLIQSFKAESKLGKFTADGRIYPKEILLRIGYLENGRLRQVNFEASAEYSSEQQEAMDRIYLCLDATAGLMAEYFEHIKSGSEEDPDFPLIWKEFEIEKKKVFLQFTTINSELEAEADRLLGISGESLVVGEDEGIAEDEEPAGDDDSGEEDPDNLH